MSKQLEHVNSSEFKAHLISNHLFELFLSGFNTQHSYNAAILKVTANFLLFWDCGQNFIYLNLSTALEAIRHNILTLTPNIIDSAFSWLR